MISCGFMSHRCRLFPSFDLKQRWLLERTLVIWGGDFGRTPMVESNLALGRKMGRDHHPQALAI